MPKPPPLIALLTDFGLDDWYVAAMKGRILARLPEARILDVSHGVPACRIESGAFLLRCVLPAMPAGTVFCCVVDPGVGTNRRAMCGRIGRWGFAGPDNGLATPLLDDAGPDFALFEIESPEFRSESVGSTFHGRDLFAPAAASLAAGEPPDRAGRPIPDPARLPPWQVEETADGLVARVMLADRFGNLVTNLERRDWEDRLREGRYEIRAGGLRIESLRATFGEAALGEGLAYWGSSGTLEIAINRGSAAAATGLAPGDAVSIILRK